MRSLLYIPPLGGGLEDLRQAGQDLRFLRDYCDEYLKHFDRVFVLSFFAEDGSNYRALPTVASGRVVVLGNAGGLHRYLYAILAPFIHRRALRSVEVIRVSQATGALPALAMSLWFRLLGRRRRVATTYGYDYVLFASIRGRTAVRLARFHERLARLVSDRWITTTAALKQLLEDRHGAEPGNIWLIANGVKAETFLRAEPRSLGAEPVTKLVFVGRLEAQKDLPLLFRCVRAAEESLGRKISLRILGSGSLREELEGVARSLSLGVEFLGSVEHSRLPGLLAEAHAFVTATRFEGNPKALLEALAIGIPVIGRRSPGVSDLLTEAGQELFDDEASFVRAVRSLDDPARRAALSAAAKECVRSQFVLEKNLEKEGALLRKLSETGNA